MLNKIRWILSLALRIPAILYMLFTDKGEECTTLKDYTDKYHMKLGTYLYAKDHGYLSAQENHVCDCMACENTIIQEEEDGIQFDINKVTFIVAFLISFMFFSSCNHPAHADIVSIAQSQIGKGEIGGDNKGEEVKEYTRGKEVAWCAGFVSWVLSRAGQQKGKDYFLSAKSFWEKGQYTRVSSPRAGDIIVFFRKSRMAKTGHVGIVERVQGDDITTIEGNVGAYPAKVKRCHYKLGEIKNLLGFVRI